MNSERTKDTSAWDISGIAYNAPVPARRMLLPPALQRTTMPYPLAPVPPPPEARQYIMAVCDLAGLRTHLATQLAQRTHSCDETFAHTEAFLARCSPAVDIPQVLTLLRNLDAHCDCETYFILRALLVH